MAHAADQCRRRIRDAARLVEEALERVPVANQLSRQELDRNAAHEPLMFS
jgi:hypothetical protein